MLVYCVVDRWSHKSCVAPVGLIVCDTRRKGRAFGFVFVAACCLCQKNNAAVVGVELASRITKRRKIRFFLNSIEFVSGILHAIFH